jgi:putative ABC transport system ATP-binding protein
MASNGERLIHLEGIKKVFFTDEVEAHALAEGHLEVEHGEYVASPGRRMRETTLLDPRSLIRRATEYTHAGEAMATPTASERARIRNRQIGFIFQAFNLIGDLTVAENVELPLTYLGMAAAERKQRVQNALERVGMAHRMRHYPSQLSGGQQQRVAVARAVAGDPVILLADEPTGNLDSKNGEAVM